jgi:hypothetical protein
VVSEFALAKLPVPLDVQVTPALLVALDPAVIFTAPELEHVETAVPATAVGACVIVIASVCAALLPQPLSAVTDSVPLVAPAAKSILMLVVPLQLCSASAEYAQVYEVAPATAAIEYELPLYSHKLYLTR